MVEIREREASDFLIGVHSHLKRVCEQPRYFKLDFYFRAKLQQDPQFGSHSRPNLIPRSVNPNSRKSQSVYIVNPFIWMGSIYSQIGRVCVWYRVLISGWPYQASRLFCILHAAAAARFYGTAKTEFGMEAVRSGAAAEKFSPLLSLALSAQQSARMVLQS